MQKLKTSQSLSQVKFESRKWFCACEANLKLFQNQITYGVCTRTLIALLRLRMKYTYKAMTARAIAE